MKTIAAIFLFTISISVVITGAFYFSYDNIQKIMLNDGQNEMDALVGSKLVSICDLNGDKVTEFIITTSYYEGGGYDIMTFEQGKFESYLSCICGT